MNLRKLFKNSALVFVLTLAFLSCIRGTSSLPEMAVNLYSGIRGVMSLGDTESQVLSSLQLTPSKELIEDEPLGTTLKSLEITHVLNFQEIGAKAYFKSGRVILIEMQEPFKGQIQGKKITLFSLKMPEEKTWFELLSREFGPPQARASGGSFGSEALFYTWGDISYNRMGPNQLALYRDAAISSYRQKFFGRQLKLFNK